MNQRILNNISKQGLRLCRNSVVRNTSIFNANLYKIQQVHFKQRFDYKNSHKYYSTDSNQESKTDSNSNSNSSSSKKKMSFKELMSKYGWAAFIMYNIVTIIDISIIFVYLHFSGADQVKYIENKVKEWTSYLSFSKPKEDSIIKGTDDKNAIEETDNKLQESEKPSLLSTFLVAYSLHQLLEPIRLPLVVFLTPSFALKLHRLNILKMKNV